MKNSSVNDMTDVFDTRLLAMQRAQAPGSEVDAAIAVYERMRTARAICQALLPDGFTDASVVALAVELGRAVQSGQVTTSRE